MPPSAALDLANYRREAVAERSLAPIGGGSGIGPGWGTEVGGTPTPVACTAWGSCAGIRELGLPLVTVIVVLIIVIFVSINWKGGSQNFRSSAIAARPAAAARCIDRQNTIPGALGTKLSHEQPQTAACCCGSLLPHRPFHKPPVTALEGVAGRHEGVPGEGDAGRSNLSGEDLRVTGGESQRWGWQLKMLACVTGHILSGLTAIRGFKPRHLRVSNGDS